MADVAVRDENRVRALLATSNADGTTVLAVEADPTSHAVTVLDASTGSDLSDDIAGRDANRVPVMIAVSETDGVTPVEIYLDSVTGKLLLDSN